MDATDLKEDYQFDVIGGGVWCSGCGAGLGYIHADNCPMVTTHVAAVEVEKERGTYRPHSLEGTVLVTATKPLTGWSSDYYKLQVTHPTSGGPAYTTECNDIIEALGMNFAEGNAFKALWRRAAARKGNGKPGTTALYDAEKVAFFGQRLVNMEKNRK